MLKNLRKEDLIRLVKGTGGPSHYPPYPPQIDRLGQLTGFPNERWEWNNSRFEVMTEDQLWEVYLLLINNK